MKVFLPLLFLLCLLPHTGRAADPAVDAVKATMRGSAGNWKTAPLFGGSAVSAGDSALYWTAAGRVFAVNNAARQLSPGVRYAPASVDARTAGEALAGETLPLPPHLGVALWDVPGKLQGLFSDAKAAYKPTSGVEGEKLAVSWATLEGTEQRGTLEVRETGGMVTNIQAVGLMLVAEDKEARQKFNRPGFAAIVAGALLVLEQDEFQAVLGPLLSKDLMQGRKTTESADHNGMRFTVGRLDAEETGRWRLYLEISPAGPK